MKNLIRSAAIALGAALLCAPAQAIVIAPNDFGGPHCFSPAFGVAACGITTAYDDGGLVFDGKVAVFNDPPAAWGGINASNRVDLVSPVAGHFVFPNTSILAVTGFLSVEIGNSVVGSLLLSVFDVNGNLLGSSLNDDGTGPHGRTLATLTLPGIHSFIVSGADTWGMNQIEFGQLIPPPDSEVPEPGTMLLLGSGLAGMAIRRRRRQ